MLRKTSLILFGILVPLATMASGPWLPERLLSNGGKKIFDAPEFYFELEMKQLATHYPTPFKAVKNDGEKSAAPAPAQAKEAGLYAQGAEAYKAGHSDEARSAWKELLTLPEGERRALSTSAAYMLGRMNIDRPFSDTGGESAESQPSDSPSAGQPRTAQDQARDEETVGYFRQVRDLAQKGLTDPDGLAGASLGWEAYVELHRGAYDKAATLYLQQLATGDLRAVDSLKAVACKLTDDAASNPLLRRIRTADILCYKLVNAGYNTASSEASAESTKWLSAVEKGQVERVEESERLAWAAYCVGDYGQAERWLLRADPETGLALWLHAKLLLREGKLEAATAAMAQAIRKIPDAKIHSAEDDYYYGHDMPVRVAAGDFGLLLLARSDFLGAFHQFLQGNHWEDAAFVAERILTLGELRQLVDKEFPAIAQDEQPAKGQKDEDFWYDRWLQTDHRLQMRWLLGRRLVRAGEFAVARPYLPARYREALDRYAAALQRGENRKAAPEERARNLFVAAVILRRNGMELVGTEVEPDSTLSDGMFPASEVWEERVGGKTVDSAGNPWSSESWTGEHVPRDQKLFIPVSAAEHKRLEAHKVEPEKRFHYRYTAADLAWRAAKLLPDNDARTADVLNTAGSWLKDRDDKAADRFVQAIERRCQNTDIGQEVLKKHWFVDQEGPWSGAAQANP